MKQEIKVFISYAWEDWETAKRLYNDLKAAGASPWLSTVDILPGQNWKEEISQAIKKSSYFIALLSTKSVSKEGFFQKELKMALEKLEYISESDIFLIPVRLDDCQPSDEIFNQIQWVDLFPSYEDGLNKILHVLIPEKSYKKNSSGKLLFKEYAEPDEDYQVVTIPKSSLQSFNLMHALRGHYYNINRIAWSPNGQILASPSNDKTIRLWNAENGELLDILKDHTDSVNGVAWSPNGQILASCSNDNTIRLWDVENGNCRLILEKHKGSVFCVSWSSDGLKLASGSQDKTARIWGEGATTDFISQHKEVYCVSWSPNDQMVAIGTEDKTIELWDMNIEEHQILEGHNASILSTAWSPDGKTLVSGSSDFSIRLWNTETGKEKAVMEGHTGAVCCVSFSFDGRFIASKSFDNTVRIWSCDTMETVAVLDEWGSGSWTSGLAFHPHKHILATLDEKDTDIRIWELNPDILTRDTSKRTSAFYTNAKVVLVGESSTGKTCLARALMGKFFKPQESTHGMKVWNFNSEISKQPDGNLITRETLLWDLAGQTEYQLVHQLFLDITALGIILFDPTHPENPFSGVKHWEKALQRVAGKDNLRLLIAGRVDRGNPTATDSDIEDFCRRYGFLEFISTSAKTGQGIARLRTAISQTIPWDKLPVTSSPMLWHNIREYLQERRMGKDILVQKSDLYKAFRQKHPEAVFTEAEFDTVISHAQVQGLVWPLSFGNFVLLKPELLNDYASAVVHASRKHPEGLGCVAERKVLEAKIDFGDMTRLKDAATERALLHAVVELFIDREIAIRESEYLVFPSKFNRERPEYPKPPLREIDYSFQGPVEDIYATLAVRLFYCGAFSKNNFWKNVAEFSDQLGQICGLLLNTPDEGYGVVSIFFEENTSYETKLLFLRFVHDHLDDRSVKDTLKRERIYRCPVCGEEVIDKKAIQKRLDKGMKTIYCQHCDEKIPLFDLIEEKFGDPDLLNQLRILERDGEERKGNEVGITKAKAKKDIDEFDVFFAYNSEDMPLVEAIGKELIHRGLNPWFDKWNLQPGKMFQKEIERVLPSIKSVAVFIGPKGIGPWEDMEISVAIQQFVKRSSPVIPVLLPGIEDEPELPPFLDGFVWVSFHKEPNEVKALDRLEWGITGRNPTKL